MPELKHVYSTIGGTIDIGDPTKTGVGEPRKATLVLDWGVADGRERGQKELERDARARLSNLAGARISYISTEPGEMLQLVLASDDPHRLMEAAQALERDLRTVPGLGSVSSSASLLRPELVIVPDPARAADLGVATADIAEAARIATTGDYRQRLAKLNLAERQVPIRVGFARSALDDPALLSTLRAGRKPCAAPCPTSLSPRRPPLSVSSATAGSSMWAREHQGAWARSTARNSHPRSIGPVNAS